MEIACAPTLQGSKVLDAGMMPLILGEGTVRPAFRGALEFNSRLRVLEAQFEAAEFLCSWRCPTQQFELICARYGCRLRQVKGLQMRHIYI